MVPKDSRGKGGEGGGGITPCTLLMLNIHTDRYTLSPLQALETGKGREGNRVCNLNIINFL